MKIKSEKNTTNLKIIENKNDRYSLIKLEYKLMSTFILSQLNKYIFLLLFPLNLCYRRRNSREYKQI